MHFEYGTNGLRCLGRQLDHCLQRTKCALLFCRVFRWGSLRQHQISSKLRRSLWERRSQMLLNGSVAIHFCFDLT